jgi:hypothetical protein
LRVIKSFYYQSGKGVSIAPPTKADLAMLLGSLLTLDLTDFLSTAGVLLSVFSADGPLQLKTKASIDPGSRIFLMIFPLQLPEIRNDKYRIGRSWENLKLNKKNL